jgi:hypothetical protein
VNRSGWREKPTRNIAFVALLIACALSIPAAFASACDSCGAFTGAQAVARFLVAFSPMWLLLIAIASLFLRAAVVALAVTSSVMSVVALVLGTDWRTAFEPLGLATAVGFAAYAIPFAVVAVVAILDLRGTERPTPD